MAAQIHQNGKRNQKFYGCRKPDPVAGLRPILSQGQRHKSRNGGKIRVSQGGKGVRVMFSKDADMAFWQRRSEAATKGKKFVA